MTDRELLETLLVEVKEIKQLLKPKDMEINAQLLGTELNAVMVQAEKTRARREGLI